MCGQPQEKLWVHVSLLNVASHARMPVESSQDTHLHNTPIIAAQELLLHLRLFLETRCKTERLQK